MFPNIVRQRSSGILRLRGVVKKFLGKVWLPRHPRAYGAFKPGPPAYKHIGEGENAEDVHLQTRITFEKADEGTNLTIEQEFPTKEELERVD